MLEITFPLLMLLAYVGLFVWAIAYICRSGWSGLRDVVSDLLGFSVAGFSVRRLACFLAVINGLLTPLHWWADWRGDDSISLAAILLSLSALVLCLFTSRALRGRFLPVAFCVIFTINHLILCKA